MRVLALDHGEARCGVAICDPTETLSTPLGAVARPDTRRGTAELVRLVHDREVGRVVVGLPLTMRGEEGLQAQAARAFAEKLRGRLAVPVDMHDERLTTRQAERTGGRADADSRAAAHLLEAYLAASAGARP